MVSYFFIKNQKLSLLLCMHIYYTQTLFSFSKLCYWTSGPLSLCVYKQEDKNCIKFFEIFTIEFTVISVEGSSKRHGFDLILNVDMIYVYQLFQGIWPDIDLMLLRKLVKSDFSSPLIMLLHSYVFNRKWFVAYNAFTSGRLYATSGVPQGSNLGPLLFILFVNDLIEIIDVSCLTYADDMKLLSKIENVNSCIRFWCQNSMLVKTVCNDIYSKNQSHIV